MNIKRFKTLYIKDDYAKDNFKLFKTGPLILIFHLKNSNR